MKRIALFSMVLALLACNFSVHAQVEKAMKSYNFSRALEEREKGNNTDALDFLNKEIAEKPNNPYAFYYIALIQGGDNNYAEAMEAINKAIKTLPKKDKVYRARAYASRANLYSVAGDTVQCLSDLGTALKINPSDDEILDCRAQILYEMKRYEDADADYRKMVELNPMSVMGYMGLGRNARDRGDHDEAIRQYNIAIGMHDDYSSGYAFRGESYLKQGKYLEAIDDLLKSLSIDSDHKAFTHLLELPREQVNLAVVKLKAMEVKDPNNAEWPYYRGLLYEKCRMYPEAVEAFSDALDIDVHPLFLGFQAECYSFMGKFDSALDAISQAQQISPDDFDLIQVKADVLGDSGNVEGAIAEWTNYIDKNPDYYVGYYRRGFFEENSGLRDKALEDYDMAIMLNPDYAYAYLGKGDILKLQGKDDEARAAYTRVVELDTVPNNSSCAMYALLELGERERALDFMNRVIEQDSLYAGNHYDGACLLSRMGDLDKSLSYLKRALELGFKRIHHVYADDDLEALRETDGFKALMEEYRPAVDTPATDEEDEETTPNRTEIPFTPDGGCASVKCTINGLPLNFIFDTGASTVSMSMTEAKFMLKNGYLHADDFVGSERFVDANGDISEGTVIVLRNVDFGGLTLNNVRASVVRNQKAPLLLGQSVLGRMGTIEIDNKNRKLIITNHSKTK